MVDDYCLLFERVTQTLRELHVLVSVSNPGTVFTCAHSYIVIQALCDNNRSSKLAFSYHSPRPPRLVLVHHKTKPTSPKTNRQGLGLHHVRAVGAHILAKVHETGFRTEPDGRCFMTPARAGPNPVVCAASDPILNCGITSSTAQSLQQSRETVQRCRRSRGWAIPPWILVPAPSLVTNRFEGNPAIYTPASRVLSIVEKMPAVVNRAIQVWSVKIRDKPHNSYACQRYTSSSLFVDV